jgi:hypothetical protein
MDVQHEEAIGAGTPGLRPAQPPPGELLSGRRAAAGLSDRDLLVQGTFLVARKPGP